MSGTLIPTEMYRDILGLNKNTILKEYANPFPKENRCILISKEITTKFEDRTDEMYRKIAIACAQVINNLNGNSAIFFSSYDTLRSTMKYLDNIVEKKLFVEGRGMTKEERSQLLANFKMNLINGGGAIIGVQGANFSEGIDLPGELLTAVVVVGLPFAPPDLRQKAIIDYYEDNFGRGWDYGYIFPAMNKSLQAAGRCIRSETDKGLIILLDKRFAWSKYAQILPPDWDVTNTDDFSGEVAGLFKR
jgi:DNA excision repair protein ERCC-2